MKIAVTGTPGSNKALIALSLSYITKTPFMQNRTMYEWFQLYDITGTGEKTAWKNMFLIAASSFIERTETETRHDRFISKGAVFSELVYMQSVDGMEENPGVRRERENIVQGLEHVCMSYAVKQYDAIIHLYNGKDTQANELYIRLYGKYGMPYRQYQANNIAGTLMQALADLNLKAMYSIERGIYQAEKTLLIRKL
ncbi:MAG: hypothetical protein LBS69_04385 [Prevotellaceae bacterium]|jgi:hypothetical protein|nr:hypothetical protein [Prevotellaceae bacterium]